MSDRFPQPPAGHRDWYAFEALRALPRILLMVDRNPFSKTYGCFDREFWHYRTVDFPCGMSQEMGLPLAMAFRHPFPHNPYRGLERLQELVVGSIELAREASHRDGSCDDYFPFERALGALVFSTYAMTESYLQLELDRPDLLEFFARRGDWLRTHDETGRLANHQAFAALALYNVHLLTGEERFREASRRFRDRTLDWQHEEGWFQEYEGADPGYHTCSISFLARLFSKSGDETLLAPLLKAVELAAYFLHPDGSYGGEYGSRNTYHFYPYGFEVLAPFSPAAAHIADTYLRRSLPERRRYFNDDNRMCAHYVYDWMQAWLERVRREDGEAGRASEQVSTAPAEPYRPALPRWLEGARIFVSEPAPGLYTVVSLAKGGVLKITSPDGPVASDTGPIAETEDGEVLVSHLVDDHTIEVDAAAGRLRVSGFLSRRRQPLPSPLKQILFRLLNLTLGRLSPNLLRAAIQRLLITGKPRTEARFRREILLGGEGVRIRDHLDLSATSLRLRRLAVGSDATSIYVANSNTFQESVLLPWIDLSGHVEELNRRRRLDLPERRIAMPGTPPEPAPTDG
jgi:hypothetical protein